VSDIMHQLEAVQRLKRESDELAQESRIVERMIERAGRHDLGELQRLRGELKRLAKLIKRKQQEMEKLSHER
jgi:seryl-tRNA synthetase